VTAVALAADAEPPRRLKYPTKARPRPRVVSSELPDPAPLCEKGRYRIDVRWDKETPSILTVNTVDNEKAEPVERWAGRFALELFEHGVLIERARFNFPMLGASRQERAKSMAAAIDANLSSTTEVAFPATSRGDRFELRDRATGKRWQLAWPPKVEPLRVLPPDERAPAH
jgi:hypothetical protein